LGACPVVSGALRAIGPRSDQRRMPVGHGPPHTGVSLSRRGHSEGGVPKSSRPRHSGDSGAPSAGRVGRAIKSHWNGIWPKFPPV
jgi:hypothetical protein